MHTVHKIVTLKRVIAGLANRVTVSFRIIRLYNTNTLIGRVTRFIKRVEGLRVVLLVVS